MHYNIRRHSFTIFWLLGKLYEQGEVKKESDE